MFLALNTCKVCKSHFNFYCKEYFWRQPFKGFSYKRCSYKIYLLISNKVAGSRFALLVEVGSFVSIFQGFCLIYSLCEKLFLRNCSSWLPQYFKGTFDFNPTQKKRFLQSTLYRQIFYIWYCISYLLNINSAMVIQNSFLLRWLNYWCNAFINLQFLILVYSLDGFSTVWLLHFLLFCQFI